MFCVFVKLFVWSNCWEYTITFYIGVFIRASWNLLLKLGNKVVNWWLKVGWPSPTCHHQALFLHLPSSWETLQCSCWLLSWNEHFSFESFVYTENNGYIFCCQEGFGKVGRRQELVCLFLAPLLSLPRWSDNAIVLHSSLLMVCNPGFASHDSNMLIILWPLYSLVISEHKKLQVLMTNYNQSVGHPLLDIFDQWH